MLKLFKKYLLLVLALVFGFSAWAKGPAPLASIQVSELPFAAQQTLALIKQAKPMPGAKDGVVFHNYEGVLPKQKRGYYREYTVKTPGVRHRGARRIVAGGEASQFGEYFYTDDHYVSFRRIRE